jgi:YbbR domain-containing protein
MIMGKFFHDHVLHNLGIKVISLLLAIGLWWVVARDPVSEIPVDVAVEFHGIPENLEITTENIPPAQVRVSGPERVIHRLRPSDVHLELDMSGARPGERTFDLTPHEVHQPYELDVVQIIPSQLRLNFDTRMTRTVDIHPRIVGTPMTGYRVGRVVLDPPVMTVSGPQQRVEAVDGATTDPIDISSNNAQTTFQTRAYVADPLVRVVHPGPIHVTVMMEKIADGNRGD